MSARLATPLGRRTSRPKYHRTPGSALARVRPKRASRCQTPPMPDATWPSTAPSTSSRRCARWSAARATGRSGSPAARSGGRRGRATGPATLRAPRRGRRLAAGRGVRAPRPSSNGPPRLVGIDRPAWSDAASSRTVHPLIDRPRPAPSRRPDLPHGGRDRRPRPGHPRAEGHGLRGASGLARARPPHGEPAPGPAGAGAAAVPAGRRPWPPLPVLRPPPVRDREARGPTDPARGVAGAPGSRRSSTCPSPTPRGAADRSVPGSGPWTAAEVAVRALGDDDAVSVGDFHLPNLVGWSLAQRATRQ